VSQAADQSYIGHVIDLIDGTGSHDTLVLRLATTAADVASSTNRVALVPFVKAIVPVVDVQSKQLVIAPPEGLLELASHRKLPRVRPSTVTAFSLGIG
jgi:16S rRNA processing protein RimM